MKGEMLKKISITAGFFLCLFYVGAIMCPVIVKIIGACAPYWYIIAVILIFLYLFIRKDMKEAKAIKNKEKQRAADKPDKQPVILKELPLSLSEKEELNRFVFQIKNFIFNKYYIKDIIFELDDTELYKTIKNKEMLPAICMTFSGHKLSVYLENGMLLNEEVLEPFARPKEAEKEKPPVKKKRVSTKVKNARMLRKHPDDVIIKNGKRYQRPNYEFFAKEWLIDNIGELSNIVLLASTGIQKKIVAEVPADILPKDRNVWKYIGQQLKQDDEIDQFEVIPTGLKIIIFKK